MNISESISLKLLNQLPGLYCRYFVEDEAWLIHYLSERCNDILGYSFDELEHKDSINWVLQEDRESLTLKRKSIQDSNKTTVEYRIVNKLGEVKWVKETYQAILDDEQKLAYIEGYIEEINDNRTSFCDMGRT